MKNDRAVIALLLGVIVGAAGALLLTAKTDVLSRVGLQSKSSSDTKENLLGAATRPEPDSLKHIGLDKYVDDYLADPGTLTKWLKDKMDDGEIVEINGHEGTLPGFLVDRATGKPRTDARGHPVPCPATVYGSSAKGAWKVHKSAANSWRHQGYFIGWVENKSSDCEDEKYGIRPSQRVMVFAEINKATGMFFIRFIQPGSSPADEYDVVHAFDPKRLIKWHECGGYNSQNRDFVDFRYHDTGCNVPGHTMEPPPSLTKSGKSLMFVLPFASSSRFLSAFQGDGVGDTVWFSCDLTCCYADT